MLLRPATPLTVLLLIAFTLLLLSVISTPIVRGIPLARRNNIDYGVFGYCEGNLCTKIHVRYTPNGISSTIDNNFDLPSGARKSLSSILIIHPIAAFLTLICLVLAAAAHFHSPSHSPRYLSALLILFIPTLLVTLLAFLVDILLFVPHLAWGGWIVLAATIIHVSCGVITCAMRRTLVSRKARKRRIAENAEMNRESDYGSQNAAGEAAGFSGHRQEAIISEAKEALVFSSAAHEPSTTFATFRASTRSSDDDHTPLSSHSPSNDIRAAVPMSNLTPGCPRSDPGPVLYGAASSEFTGSTSTSTDTHLHSQTLNGSMAPRRAHPPPGALPRGRGGYPPRGYHGRGGLYGGPRGPLPNGRGSPRGPMRAMRGGPPGIPGRGRGSPGDYGPIHSALGHNYDQNERDPYGKGQQSMHLQVDDFDYGRFPPVQGSGSSYYSRPLSGQESQPMYPPENSFNYRQPLPGRETRPILPEGDDFDHDRSLHGQGPQPVPPPDDDIDYDQSLSEQEQQPLPTHSLRSLGDRIDYGKHPQGLVQHPSPGPTRAAMSDHMPISQAIEMTPQPQRVSHSKLAENLQLRNFNVESYERSARPTSLYNEARLYSQPRESWARDTVPSSGDSHELAPSRTSSQQAQPNRYSSGVSYYEDVDPRFADNEAYLERLPSSLVPGFTPRPL